MQRARVLDRAGLGRRELVGAALAEVVGVERAAGLGGHVVINRVLVGPDDLLADLGGGRAGRERDVLHVDRDRAAGGGRGGLGAGGGPRGGGRGGGGKIVFPAAAPGGPPRGRPGGGGGGGPT